MAGPSSSSSERAPNSVDEKLVSFDSSEDGAAEVLRIGVRPTTRKAETSSLVGQTNNPQKRKGKALKIGDGEFDEVSDLKLMTSKYSESNLQIKSWSERQEGSMECGCCYRPYEIERMVQCGDCHWFCFKCIRKQVDQIIYGVVKADYYLSCMAIVGCKEPIHLSEIKRALPNDVIERYEHRQAQQAVVEAKIEGLVYCPFCNIPYETDNCAQVLDCPNPSCLISSCIQCKKVSHSPLRCEEVEKHSDTGLRTAVEERMTKAVVRECNICHTELIKTSGCNVVTCKCGNQMCYVCRKTISDLDFSHFCRCVEYSGAPGKPCEACNRCDTRSEIEDNEALDAREEALKELVERKSELLDVEIGPPLKRVKRQHLEEQQRHNLQRLIPDIVVPPPLPPLHFFRFGDGDHLPNMGIPPPGFFTFDNGDQLEDMTIHQLLPTTQSFGHDDENMAIPPLQPALENFRIGNQLADIGPLRPFPPLHLFRFGDGDQLTNMAIPPPDFFTSDNGDQLENMTIHQLLPTTQSFRVDDFLENMAIPPLQPALDDFRIGNQLADIGVLPPFPPLHFFRFGDGDQLANMALTQPHHDVHLANVDLQAEEGSSRDEQLQ